MPQWQIWHYALYLGYSSKIGVLVKRYLLFHQSCPRPRRYRRFRIGSFYDHPIEQCLAPFLLPLRISVRRAWYKGCIKTGKRVPTTDIILSLSAPCSRPRRATLTTFIELMPVKPAFNRSEAAELYALSIAKQTTSCNFPIYRNCLYNICIYLNCQ